MAIIGLDAFGINPFQSYSPPVRNIKYIEMKNGIFDEVHIREKTDGIDTSNVKEDWQLDTILLARFLGDLEAGNINNGGIQIVKFAIKRRGLNEINSLTLGYKDFVNNNQFVFDDYTQSNDDYVYSIVPVGENGLEGSENSAIVSSDFAGWHILDRESNQVVSFDTFLGSENSIDVSFNQSRTQIDTLSKYPKFVYTDQQYNTFQLKGLFIAEDWQKTGKMYKDILDQFVLSHKPFLVKNGEGNVYICEATSPVKSSPQNIYRGRDYMELTLSFTEIMDYEEYMELTTE
jgi:hypothetical protein